MRIIGIHENLNDSAEVTIWKIRFQIEALNWSKIKQFRKQFGKLISPKTIVILNAGSNLTFISPGGKRLHVSKIASICILFLTQFFVLSMPFYIKLGYVIFV